MKLKKMISVCLLFVLLLAGSLWIDQTMLSSEKPKPEEVAQEMAADTEKMTESMSSLLYKILCPCFRRLCGHLSGGS